MGTTVGGEQEAPTARYLSAGDDEAPSVGLRTARVARSKQGSRPCVVPARLKGQAHLPPVRLSVGARDRWNDARAGPPLGCVYDQQYTVGVVKRQQAREQKFLRNKAEESILLFPYG